MQGARRSNVALPEIIVDPFIFCLPDVPTSHVVHEYLEGVLAWGQVLRTRESVTSEAAVGELQMADRYPTYENLRKLISGAQVEFVSVVDVQQWLRVLSERSPYLEDVIAIRDSDCQGALDPTAAESRLPARAAAAFKNALASTIIHADRHDEALPNVGTRGLDGCFLRFTGCVTITADQAGDVANVPVSDQEITGAFPLVQNPADLTHREWDDVCNEPQAAISFFLVALGIPDAAEVALRVRIGPEFVASLHRAGMHGQPARLRRLYRLCAIAAAGQLSTVNGASVHPVRVSVAADAAQVTRNGCDALWRCMVSKRGAGYRLHYWTCGDGTTELHELMVESEV